MATAYIVDAVRTPTGRRNGALSGIHPVELGALPIRALLERTGVEGPAVEDVVYGCVTPIGDQGGNVGRDRSAERARPRRMTLQRAARWRRSDLVRSDRSD